MPASSKKGHSRHACGSRGAIASECESERAARAGVLNDLNDGGGRCWVAGSRTRSTDLGRWRGAWLWVECGGVVGAKSAII